MDGAPYIIGDIVEEDYMEDFSDGSQRVFARLLILNSGECENFYGRWFYKVYVMATNQDDFGLETIQIWRFTPWHVANTKIVARAF